MGRKSIKVTDLVRLNAYLVLNNTSLDLYRDYWTLTTGNDRTYYETTADMMKDVNKGLRKIRKECRELDCMDIYEKAMDNDGELRI